MLRYVQRAADRHWFPKPEDMPEALHQLLIERGIRSAEEAEAYLRADERCLHDPLQLSDMMPAVNRIKAALEAGKPYASMAIMMWTACAPRPSCPSGSEVRGQMRAYTCLPGITRDMV